MLELVPHSNHADVSVPFGLTEPFSVEEAREIDDAPAVVAVGATGFGPTLSPPPPPPHLTRSITRKGKRNRFKEPPQDRGFDKRNT